MRQTKPPAGVTLRCCRCGAQKPLKDFGAQRRGPRRPTCRKCVSARGRLTAEDRRRIAQWQSVMPAWRASGRAKRARDAYWQRREAAYQRDKERRDFDSRKRRALTSGATAEPFTARDLRTDWGEHDLWSCFFCGDSLTNGYDVEHFYPLSKGGPHALFNLVPSCAPCNRGAGGKGTKEPWGYLRESLAEQGTDLDACLALLDGRRGTSQLSQP